MSRYDTDITRKLLDLRDFSVYWDNDTQCVGHLGKDMKKVEDMLRLGVSLGPCLTPLYLVIQFQISD